jgi:uncharacterized protein YodC (DUF2158 family)
MKYKSGDVVIKTTGGNKMSIFDNISESVYRCIWCSDDKVREGVFNEDEIIPLSEYKTLEERELKINQILKRK